MKRTHSEPPRAATAASCSSSCMTAIPPAWTVPRGTAGPAGWKTTPNAWPWRRRLAFPVPKASVPLGRFQDLSGLLTHGVSWEMPLKTAVSRETVIQVDICPPAMLVNYDCNTANRNSSRLMGRERLAEQIPCLAAPLQEAIWPVDPHKSEQLPPISCNRAAAHLLRRRSTLIQDVEVDSQVLVEPLYHLRPVAAVVGVDVQRLEAVPDRLVLGPVEVTAKSGLIAKTLPHAAGQPARVGHP